jgi:hypothetical protein
MIWQLIVKTIRGEHVIVVGADEQIARAALAEVEAHIDGRGVVRIADRLTLRAEDITAAQIVDRYVRSHNPRRPRYDTPKG